MERLQRILAARGVASRRAAEELITAGRVTVDGKVVRELGTKADPSRAQIRVDGKLLRTQRPRYLILNKPRGYITTTKDERDRRMVMDIVKVAERVYPVGRLDRDTEGLLLLTNDGDVANRVMHPRYELDKEYHILTLARPSDAVLQRVRDGVVVNGHRVVPEEFRILRQSPEGLILKMVVHEGTYHLVRNVMDAVGIPVERLRRVRVGPLGLAGLPVGAWRDLTPGEQTTLFEAIHLERETAETAPGRQSGRREARAGRQRSSRPTSRPQELTDRTDQGESTGRQQGSRPAASQDRREHPRGRRGQVTRGAKPAEDDLPRSARKDGGAARRTDEREERPNDRWRSQPTESRRRPAGPSDRHNEDRSPRQRNDERDSTDDRRGTRQRSSPRGRDEQSARPPRGRPANDRRGSPPRDRDRRSGGVRQNDRGSRAGRSSRRDLP